MSCSLVPSVTIYGTTQLTISTTISTTYTSTITSDPVISLDGVQLVTITPVSTTVITTSVPTQTVVTSVVPQQTLYYPCSSATSATTKVDKDNKKSSTTTSSSSAVPTFSSASTATMGVSQFLSAVQAEESSTVPSSVAQFTASSTVNLNSLMASSSSYTYTSFAETINNSIAISGGISTKSQSSNTDPSSHTGTASTTASSASSADAASSSSTSSSHTAAIVGGIIGGLIGLVLLCVGMAWCRRRADQDEGWEGRTMDTKEDYWERRFRELEAEAESPDGEGEKSDSGDGAGVESKKLRLTLDLASKELPSRPASRLSMISAFFARSLSNVPTLSTGPLPFRPQSSQSQGLGGRLNFSRPLGRSFDPNGSTAEMIPPVPVLHRDEEGDRDLERGRSVGSIKSRSEGRRKSNRLSEFAPLSRARLSLKGFQTTTQERGDDNPSGRTTVLLDTPTDFSPTGDSDSRRGMEWIRSRPISEVSVDTIALVPRASAPDLLGDPPQQIRPPAPEREGAGENGGYPSMRALKRWSDDLKNASPVVSTSIGGTRSPATQFAAGGGPHELGQDSPSQERVGSKLPSTTISNLTRNPSNSTRSSYSTHAAHSRPTSHVPLVKSPKPKVHERHTSRSPHRRSLASPASRSSSATRPKRTSALTPPTPRSTGPQPKNSGRKRSSTQSRTLYPPPSSNASSPASPSAPSGAPPKPKRDPRRPPGLSLSREAVTPSLWLDEELLAQIDAGESKEVSIFSPDTATTVYGGMEEVGVTPAGVTGSGMDSATYSGLVGDKKEGGARSGGGAGEGGRRLTAKEKGKGKAWGTALYSDTMPSPGITESNVGCGNAEGPTAYFKSGEPMERTFQRSAVTPQLPVLNTGSPMNGAWYSEGEERTGGMY